MEPSIKPSSGGKNRFKNRLDGALKPLSSLLAAWGVRPNGVTLAGFLATWMVPVEILREKWPAAGAWLLAASLFDVLDGVLARNGGFQSRFGAFWDSTLDRLSEAVVFGGLLLYYDRHREPEALLLAFGACVLSFLVSYTRARAEGLGLDCEVGVLPRPGRVILLAFGFFASLPTAALALVAALSLVTAVQRVVRVRRGTGGGQRGEQGRRTAGRSND